MDETGIPPSPRTAASVLLKWFSDHGRAFLWRSSRDPYRVLVAEILLRKTGVHAVEQFLPSFLGRYPDVRALAAASIEELADELAILGLRWQRARQLHNLAQKIISEYGGEIPATEASLAGLPGVGRYTAGIVAATSYNATVPAVDTNVARVICRVFGIIPSHAEARKSTNVWAVAGELVAAQNGPPAQVTWAILDLGATICTVRKPDCPRCPLRELCLYGRAQLKKRNI